AKRDALATKAERLGLPRQVVIDASAVLRLLLDNSQEVAEVIRRDELVAPAVINAETANGLVTATRFGDLELEEAESLLNDFLGLEVELVPDAALAREAFGVAANLGLSAY